MKTWRHDLNSAWWHFIKPEFDEPEKMAAVHEPDSHHTFDNPAPFGPFSGYLCICGEPEGAVIHDSPPCPLCVAVVRREPWWRRLWYRFTEWVLR